MEYIPDDETGAAIKQWSLEGSDLSLPMTVDFFVSLPNQETGVTLCQEPALGDFSLLTEKDPETGRWTCYCSKVVIPTYTTIVEIENLLTAVAKRYGAEYDGFGSFGNAGDNVSS